MDLKLLQTTMIPPQEGKSKEQEKIYLQCRLKKLKIQYTDQTNKNHIPSNVGKDVLNHCKHVAINRFLILQSICQSQIEENSGLFKFHYTVVLHCCYKFRGFSD